MHNVTLADGTVIRELASHDERAEAVRIQDETWGAGFTERVPAAILLVAQKTGGIVAGAFDPGGRMLGFVFGVAGVRGGRPIHWSDMLAVRTEAQGRRLGEALKRYQRDVCRALGIETMFWTFDPFVARNAHLNLNRLGAHIDEFVPDMYGANTSSPLHSLGTDRFVAAWSLRGDPVPMPGAEASLAGVPVVIASGTASAGSAVEWPEAPVVAVHIPDDYAALVARDLERARRWRAEARRAFVHYLSAGYRVSDFVPGRGGDAAYLLARTG